MRKIIFVILFVLQVSFVLGASAQTFSGSTAGTARFVTQPDFNTFYSGSQLQTYWPILGDKDTCQARQDILLQIPPGGCQPSVVRSDLLAEQNVPVFCQIDALTLNPLLDVKKIENIRFTGKYPAQVIGTGFHPARASLQTHDKLLGSPLINNIGYIVVVLKKNARESDLPSLVNLTLSAQVDYDAQDALGIGRTEFLLPLVTDQQWDTEKLRQGFWQGRYFLRADSFDANSAQLSIYYGDNKVSSVTVKKGETSRDINLAGLYCRAGIKANYIGMVSAGAVAQLKVDDEYVDVYEGSKFLNDKCSVSRVDAQNSSSLGNVSIRCSTDVSSGSFTLKINGQSYEEGDRVKLKSGDAVGTEEWVVKKSLGNGLYDLQRIGADGNPTGDLKTSVLSTAFVGVKPRLTEATLDAAAQKAFSDSIDAYKRVSEDYPSEITENVTGMTYGEVALQRAIDLAGKYGKFATQSQLIERLLSTYPNVNNQTYIQQYNDLSTYDLGSSFNSVVIAGQAHTIRLVSISAPNGGAYANFSWGVNRFGVAAGQTYDLPNVGRIVVDQLDAETVRTSVYCADRNTGAGSNDNTQMFSTRKENVKPFSLTDTEGQTLCGFTLHLDDINIQRYAKVRLISQANDVRSQTNLTVGIGIEKRAIQLAPNKTLDKIAELNKTIQKWDSISRSLGNTVSGLKTACFATSSVLIAKNFLTGLSGEGIARQKVMNSYWTDYCKQHLTSVGGEYHTLNECYLARSSDINRDVAKVKDLLNAENEQIKGIEDKYKTSASGIGGVFGESSVNTNASANDFAQVVKREHGEEVIQYGPGANDKISVDQLFNSAGYDNGEYTYDQVRDIKLNLDLAKSGSPEMQQAAKKKLTDIARVIKDNQDFTIRTKALEKDTQSGLPGYTQVFSTSQHTLITPVSVRESVRDNVPFSSTDTKYVARVSAHATSSNARTGTSGFSSGGYILGLKQQPGSQTYLVNEVVYQDAAGYRLLTQSETQQFVGTFGIADIKATDQVSYHNRIKDPEIKFYETEPYKGMPAQVPFDVQNGWYAATEQNLPVFGGRGAFEANGRVVSFWLCNVGENGVTQFFEGKGDDICQLINLNTGQPLNQFPGLSQDQAKRIIDKAVQAIQDAARNYGSGKTFIRVGDESVKIGKPAANVPGTQCQDYMSPEECTAMFNVCDPVICPASRCDLGGAYPVADVIQTGVVGSALLCLPNIREGIVVPVCLTGIKAGIDSYLSILKSERDCLQENVNSGQLVGICDEITSVYTCEFFWRQVAPVANVLLPKVVELATGQTSSRGGGEYLTVPAAWQQAQDSIKYFTDTYAVNSLQAFKIRSVDEAGTTFCRAFISAKGPSALKSLVEPDSPPQFYAWFSSIRFSDATVPATGQYKVFYHLFAGNDQGVSYSVYLKDPPLTSYYQTTSTIFVDSGFVPKGQYKSITKDFTAPEGYKQLCVRINQDEKCGFGQVSTDFAVNYVADSFAQDELTRKDITSQDACISGTPNPLALANPNIQSGVENTILPNNPGRGIVRICGSTNPGSTTDPLRFVDVGYCGDTKIRCWLDKQSVGEALTDSAVYAKNNTLDSLQKTQIEALQNAGTILPEDQATAGIKDFEDQVETLEESAPGAATASYAKDLLTRMDSMYAEVYLNHQKAHILFLRARVLEQIFAKSYTPVNGQVSSNQVVQGSTETSVEQVSSLAVVNGSGSVVSSVSVGQAVIFKVTHTCKNAARLTLIRDSIDTKSYLISSSASELGFSNGLIAGNYNVEGLCVDRNNAPVKDASSQKISLTVNTIIN